MPNSQKADATVTENITSQRMSGWSIASLLPVMYPRSRDSAAQMTKPLLTDGETRIAQGVSSRFPHRSAAAFLAMALRSFGDRAAARAFPPFDAPSFPNATAAGFFLRGLAGLGASPVAIIATRTALVFTSAGTFLGRVCIPQPI